MSIERIRASFDRIEQAISSPAPRMSSGAWSLDREATVELIESMLLTRHLDALAQQLREEGVGHYTIASAGHEFNAVLGRLTQDGDPSLVHYRSAAFQLERARPHHNVDAVVDIALSLVAAATDPLCSGRHKVLGNKRLGIIPQTSTIGSQLPRAVGLAFGIDRRARLALDTAESDVELTADSIAVVSFGDASLNHSTTQGALNAVSWVVHQRLKLPLLLVCEDNGLGISVHSPPGFVERRLRAQPHLEYFFSEGWNVDASYRAARKAIGHVRATRRPAVLHVSCERLLGHAGSDVDSSYRTPAEIRTAELRDPVLTAISDALAAGAVDASEISDLMAKTRERVQRAGELARQSPRLETVEAIAAPLALPRSVPAPAYAKASEPARATLAQGINHALDTLLTFVPQALVFGEDVAKKGGVYGVTRGLLAKHGPARVFNTLLDEQTILGLALGTASLGFLPVPEIQYLAYLHNAEDQLRGEAATLPYFSSGQYKNPMILRIAGLAYQKGFGGHFHNDNSLAVLRDIPGIVLGIPTRADDASSMIDQAAALAKEHGKVVVLVEPIALYHQRDLHTPGDEQWLQDPAGASPDFGRARIYGEGARDLLIISYGNGAFLSLRAAETLRNEHGIEARVLDLRWLSPLPMDDVEHHLADVRAALVVDECRITGSPSEEILARWVDRGLQKPVRRVASADCFIPLGDAARKVLVSERDIVGAALAVLG